MSTLSWHNMRRSGVSSSQIRTLASAKDPRHTKAEEKQRMATEQRKQNSEIRVVRRKKKEFSSTLNFKEERKLDPSKEEEKNLHFPHSTPQPIPVVQPSIYYYSAKPSCPLGLQEKKAEASRSSTRFVLPAMNASAFLDPLKYCKQSSRLSSNRTGVSRSISGTDAARRLLRGKKDFILAARSLRSQPALLEGHGVPPKLFQHCIDMADALLLQYSPDVVECTFHNYNTIEGQSKLPSILRIRSRDATNRCGSWPPENSLIQDWDYHLELYLTVMNRIACHLGMVLQRKQLSTVKKDDMEKYIDDDHDDKGDDGDELTSSPFLFPNSHTPQWNVEILRGAYYDLHKDGPQGMVSKNIPPSPIVEFNKESGNTGHVLIRLQGYSENNAEFGSQRSQQPVTLVFDACFREERN